jgi:hypothetical protein
MSDGIYDILAIEQKRLADEAKARGNTKDHAVYSAQADRFWEAQRRADSAERKARHAAEAIPSNQMGWERKAEAKHDMYRDVHIYQDDDILCNKGMFTRHEHESVRFRPDLEVAKFHRAFKAMRYYKKLCPNCLLEAAALRRE